MGGEQRARMGCRMLVQVFHHCPGNTDPVIGAGASANFIKQDEAAGADIVQNIGGFRHFHHECALPFGQEILCAHPGKHAVSQSDVGLAGRHKAPHLRHNDNERHLAHVGRLAGHIRSRQQQNLVALTVEQGVIGHKALVLIGSLQHRMPPVGNFQPVAQIEGWAAILPRHRHLGQAGQHIELT